MSTIYTRLFKNEGNYYIGGCPLILCAWALTKNTESGEVFAQARFKNIGKKNIKAVKVSLSLFDISGKRLAKCEEYQYLDLLVGIGEEFGGKVPIYLSDMTARSFRIRPVEIVFEDGTITEIISGDWEKIPDAVFLSEKISDPELIKQYEIEYIDSINACRDECRFVSELYKDVVRCDCGELYLSTVGECHKCGKKTMLFSEVDLDALAVRCAERRYKESEEQERRLAEEEKRKQLNLERKEAMQKKMKKMTVGVVFVLLATVLLVSLFAHLDKVSDEYDMQADSYMIWKEKNQKIEPSDFKNAYDSINALIPSYANKAAKLEEVKTAWGEYAISEYNSNRFKNALKSFIELADIDYAYAAYVELTKDNWIKNYIMYHLENDKFGVAYENAKQLYDIVQDNETKALLEMVEEIKNK